MKTELVITTVNMANIPIICFWKLGTTAKKRKKLLESKELKFEHSKLNIIIPEKQYLGLACGPKSQIVLTHSLSLNNKY